MLSSGQVIHAPPKKPPQPAGPSELALIAPIAAGTMLEGYSVKAVNAVENGILVIQCEKERTKITLWVALLGEGGPSAPASAGKYAVFYSLRGAESEDGEKLARAIAAILEKHGDVPVPPGLGRFVPEAIPI